MTTTTEVAATKAVKQALNGNGKGEPHPVHIEPNVGMRRPYIIESGSFYRRLEADLNYADAELEMIRVNMRALADREADLIDVRDAALSGMARLQQRMGQEPEQGLGDEGGQ